MLKFFIGYASAFVAGALLFYFLTFSLDKNIVIPIGMLGLLLLPVGVCSQIIYKTNELKENSSLKGSEQRRLDYYISKKIFRCYCWLVFYILTALLLFVVYYLGEAKYIFLKEVVVSVGGLFGVSLSSILPLHIKYIEISDFKAHLIQRENKIKRQKELLKGLRGKN
ncbi:hypothetical protein [Pantoea ananatis]|uniref:hypothetical protein n=1 Tax=Pantoea ananas TaxID=553 RepID=UPI00059BD308|nr:hypothetical protein [Pantoea ananatis]UEG19778.1 hypothetical protein LLG94_10500 [Pantoea ananatis]